VQPTHAELAHLEQLAGELRRRGFSAQLVTGGTRPCVQVANPDTPELNEQVICRTADDRSVAFWWPWRQPIGPADDLDTVVSKITTVLRSVEGPS
jgi:hypothetical protein